MSNPRKSQSHPKNSSEKKDFETLESSAILNLRNILFLTSVVCEVPVAAFVIAGDRENALNQVYGMPPEKLDLKESFIELILKEKEIIVFPALNIDPALSLENFSFFAALPIAEAAQEKPGVLLALGRQEKSLNPTQKKAFHILGEQILDFLNLQKEQAQTKKLQQHFEERYQELEKFASIVSHDLKSPLANIISLVGLLKEENQNNFGDDSREYINFLAQASENLRSYIDGLLLLYRSDRIMKKEKEDVEVNQFFSEVTNLYNVEPDVDIDYPTQGILRKVNKTALAQIFMNLISNALKYNSKARRKVSISLQETKQHYLFEISDNGNGIPRESYTKIFELFTTLEDYDRHGNLGSGIGLATVKKLVDHMEGSIDLESTPGEGSKFILKIQRSY